MFQASITREEIHKLPNQSFPGTIHIIDTVEKSNEAYAVLKEQTQLGFDTETRPNFSKNRSNKMALVQLSTSDDAYLFRINKIGVTQELREILEDKNILKIGLALRNDSDGFKPFGRLNLTNFIDLQTIVGDYGIDNRGLQKLSAIILNIYISKSQQLSNWENETLTPAQQRYSATDAWVCNEIYDVLKNVKK